MTVRTARHQAKWSPVRRPDGAPDQGLARLLRAGALASALVLATALAGCGKVGQLERPAPMFGAKAKAAAPAPTTKQEDPTRPIRTLDPRDRDAAEPTLTPPAPPTPQP